MKREPREVAAIVIVTILSVAIGLFLLLCVGLVVVGYYNMLFG